MGPSRRHVGRYLPISFNRAISIGILPFCGSHMQWVLETPRVCYMGCSNKFRCISWHLCQLTYLNKEDFASHRRRPAIDLVFSITDEVCGVQTYRDSQTPSAELVLRLFHLPYILQWPKKKKKKKATTKTKPNERTPTQYCKFHSDAFSDQILAKLDSSLRDWLQLPYPSSP